MGQAKRRGTYDERKAEAIARKRGYVYDPATKTLTPPPSGVRAVDEIHTYPRRRPLMAAQLALLAIAASAWPMDRNLFRNGR